MRVYRGPKRTVVSGTVEERFWFKVDRSGDCWEWTAARNSQGYGQFVIDRGGPRWETLPAHRIAWEFTHGPIPAGMLVCHRCDNPPCVRPDHLFLGTTLDNAVDSTEKGRQARGERNGYAKLTEDAVRDIRRRYAAGDVYQHELAAEFGVHQRQISRVVRREVWQHID